VVKPFDRSMGRGVHANIGSDQVPKVIAESEHTRNIVEEFISGIEYRSFVVGSRCVASLTKVPANILGDGASTIRQLIHEKNQKRSENPRLASNLITEMDDITEHLRHKNLTVNSVLKVDEHVELLSTSSVSRGGDPMDTTSSAPLVVAEVSMSACEAIGLSVSGLDVISAEEAGVQVAYVIELNQRPHIGSQSFPMEGPGQGNAVAEAIVDYYFPETICDKTHPTLAYDFAPIRATLDSAQISELSLPVIGPDWKVLRFSETGIAAKAMAKLIETAARTAGVFAMSAPCDKGGVELCLAHAPTNFRNMLGAIPAQFRRRLEQLDAEVKG